MKITEIKPNPKNPRLIKDERFENLKKSIQDFPQMLELRPIVVDEDNMILGGNMRYKACKALGFKDVPVTVATGLTEAQKAEFIVKDNVSGGEWDWKMLADEWDKVKLEEWGLEFPETGFAEEKNHGSLSERFLFLPFSVLNAREGVWQERKKSWIDLGIKSEEGRDSTMTYGSDNNDIVSAKQKNIKGGTSIFDPVLCELMYRWFCPINGKILDPFAGGSVRGIVASKLGFEYLGIDLREEQVRANRQQANDLGVDNVEWIIGDSNEVIPKDKQFDFIFSCPPYGDLEVYSEEQGDISNMEYEQFITAYRNIIKKSVDQLREDRFAAFVVGEFRDKNGFYRNFVSDTCNAFIDAGAKLYNEAILVTAIGTLPVRVGRQFDGSRKLGKTHQNVLVFYKGDPDRIKENYSKLNISLDNEGELISI